MSAPVNPNPQSPPNESTPTAAPEVSLNTPEVQKLYRETTVYIRDAYFPHYNLYQVNFY